MTEDQRLIDLILNTSAHSGLPTEGDEGRWVRATVKHAVTVGWHAGVAVERARLLAILGARIGMCAHESKAAERASYLRVAEVLSPGYGDTHKTG